MTTSTPLTQDQTIRKAAGNTRAAITKLKLPYKLHAFADLEFDEVRIEVRHKEHGVMVISSYPFAIGADYDLEGMPNMVDTIWRAVNRARQVAHLGLR